MLEMLMSQFLLRTGCCHVNNAIVYILIILATGIWYM